MWSNVRIIITSESAYFYLKFVLERWHRKAELNLIISTSTYTSLTDKGVTSAWIKEKIYI